MAGRPFNACGWGARKNAAVPASCRKHLPRADDSTAHNAAQTATHVVVSAGARWLLALLPASISTQLNTQFPPYPAYHRPAARTCDGVVFTRASGADDQTAPSRCTAQAPRPTAVTTRAANQPANASSIFSHDRAPYAAQSTSIHSVQPAQENFCSAGRRWRGLLPSACVLHRDDSAVYRRLAVRFRAHALIVQFWCSQPACERPAAKKRLLGD
ncbi:hypothetical protein B0J12DRAFT_762993 [Macrophomina phaseolina]|uniref:Uncharacterized protein n=1 Tax=Macrophomina phaseolina TaxID=35725 RepID=A0ABQ8GPG4_9PEZI|nr:hypothetical protein B0J12DRAFT_762993 [Macrophomina phaseolina]